MSSAICFNLDQSEILSSGNGLMFYYQAREKAEEDSDDEDEPTHPEEPPKPNPKLVAGSKLPPSLEDYFEPEHVGRPLEDIDEFYQNKKVPVLLNMADYCTN